MGIFLIYGDKFSFLIKASGDISQCDLIAINAFFLLLVLFHQTHLIFNLMQLIVYFRVTL